jgi:hypothetical protein
MRRCSAPWAWEREALRGQRSVDRTDVLRRVGPTGGATRRSASELAGQHHAKTIAPILKAPATRRSEALTVLLAQVVCMGIVAIAEVVDPHRGRCVLVRERHRGSVVTTRTRAMTTHVTKVPISWHGSVDTSCAPRLSMTPWRTSLHHPRHRRRDARSSRATNSAHPVTEKSRACRNGRSGR